MENLGKKISVTPPEGKQMKNCQNSANWTKIFRRQKSEVNYRKLVCCMTVVMFIWQSKIRISIDGLITYVMNKVRFFFVFLSQDAYKSKDVDYRQNFDCLVFGALHSRQNSANFWREMCLNLLKKNKNLKRSSGCDTASRWLTPTDPDRRLPPRTTAPWDRAWKTHVTGCRKVIKLAWRRQSPLPRRLKQYCDA